MRLVDRLMESSGEKDRINPTVPNGDNLASLITYLKDVDMDFLIVAKEELLKKPQLRSRTITTGFAQKNPATIKWDPGVPNRVLMKKASAYPILTTVRRFISAVELMEEVLSEEGQEDETLD